ncbi:hypothetical protein DSUL_150095 [Desulfovibrionales bacterium]
MAVFSVITSTSQGVFNLISYISISLASVLIIAINYLPYPDEDKIISSLVKAVMKL